LTYEQTTTGVSELESHFDVIRTYRASDDCGNYVTWQDVANVHLTTDVAVVNVPKETKQVKGTQFTLTYNLGAGLVLCQELYFFFDVGVAQIGTITTGLLTSCTTTTGGPLVCILPKGTYVSGNTLLVLPLTVPTTYLPNSLEVRMTSANSNPVDHTSTSTPTRTIVLL